MMKSLLLTLVFVAGTDSTIDLSSTGPELSSTGPEVTASTKYGKLTSSKAECLKPESCQNLTADDAEYDFPTLYECLKDAQGCPFEAKFEPETRPTTKFTPCDKSTEGNLYLASMQEFRSFFVQTLGWIEPVGNQNLTLTWSADYKNGLEVTAYHGGYEQGCNLKNSDEDSQLSQSMTVGHKYGALDIKTGNLYKTGLWVEVKGDENFKPMEVSIPGDLKWVTGGIYIAGASAVHVLSGFVTVLFFLCL